MEELTEDFEILIVAWLKSGDENATNLAHSLAKYAEKAFFIQRVSNNEAVLQYEPCLKGKLNSCKCKNDIDCKEQSEVTVCENPNCEDGIVDRDYYRKP